MENIGQIRNSLIEIVRFIAVCDVVCFHTQTPWSKYIGGALQTLTIISIIFIINSRQSFPNQLKKSFKRLILPWIFWSAIYGLLLIIESINAGTSISKNFNWMMLISGTYIHLWYLPFIFASSLVVFIITKQLKIKLNCKIYNIISLIAGLSIIIDLFLLHRFNIKYPFQQWLVVTPAIIIAFTYSVYNYKLFELIFKYGLWFIIICSIGSIMIDFRFGISYLLAVCVLALAFSYKLKKPNNYLNFLGKISYGIYLIHPLFVSFLYLIEIDPKSIWFTLFTLILSIITSSILQKTIIKKFV